MTGDAASQGAQQLNGIQLAVNEINEAGGILGKNLEFDVYDDQLNPNQTIICAEKIVADPGYRFVIERFMKWKPELTFEEFLKNK